jgi:hypothetical protein
MYVKTFNKSNSKINHNEYLFESNHPLYPFDKQITMDIILQSNKSMYPSDETH